MKKLAILLLVLLAVLLTAATVLASPPYRESGEYDYTYPLVYCGDFGDWDFTIWNNEVGDYHMIRTFDRDGALIQQTWHARGIDHLYNEHNPERTVSGHYAATWRYDFATGEEEGTGAIWNIQLPGEGAVFHVAGHLYFDADGNLVRHNGLLEDDFVTLCAYLAE